VLLIALFLSCICKNVDLEDDDIDEDEEKATMGAAEEEWWGQRETGGGRGAPVHPIDEEFLELVRQARKKEIEMWSVLFSLES